MKRSAAAKSVPDTSAVQAPTKRTVAAEATAVEMEAVVADAEEATVVVVALR